jgi:hypothetical protein
MRAKPDVDAPNWAFRFRNGLRSRRHRSIVVDAAADADGNFLRVHMACSGDVSAANSGRPWRFRPCGSVSASAKLNSVRLFSTL